VAAPELEPLPKLVTVDPRVGASPPCGPPPDLETTRFELWFTERYGVRPYNKSASRLADDLSRARKAVRQLEELRERVTEWDQRYDAALQAWTAREARDEQR